MNLRLKLIIRFSEEECGKKFPGNQFGMFTAHHVAFFDWLAGKNIILTTDNLRKKGLIIMD